MKKTAMFFAAFLFLILAAGCFAEGATVTYSNDGLKMTVPAEYADLLVIEMPENAQRMASIIAFRSL